MKKDWIIRVFLLTAYCVPFAFLSVNGDATSGTISFYGVMIAGFALLGFGALKTNNVAVLYIGNVLSLFLPVQLQNCLDWSRWDIISSPLLPTHLLWQYRLLY